MKGYLFLFLFQVVALVAISQSTVLDSTARPLPQDSVVERLVTIAYENSRVKSVESNALQSEYEYRRSRTAWLNNIVVTGNVNEFSLNQDGSSADPLKQSTQYPRYNIGVVLPLGLFVNNRKQTKASYYRYESMVDQINVEKQTIRREVKIGY